MAEEQVQALRILARFALGLGVLGGLLGVFGIYFIWTANESLSWPSVAGSVVKTEVHTQVIRRTNSVSTRRSVPVKYYVSVHYTYDVAGNPYFAARYSLGSGDRASQFFKERSFAEAEATERFPTDSQLTVYYDPQLPTAAVLEPGWNWGTFVPLLLGLFLGGAGGFFYYFVRAARVSSGQ